MKNSSNDEEIFKLGRWKNYSTYRRISEKSDKKRWWSRVWLKLSTSFLYFFLIFSKQTLWREL